MNPHSRRRFWLTPHSLPVLPFEVVPFHGTRIGSGASAADFHVVDQRGRSYAVVRPFDHRSSVRRRELAVRTAADLTEAWS